MPGVLRKLHVAVEICEVSTEICMGIPAQAKKVVEECGSFSNLSRWEWTSHTKVGEYPNCFVKKSVVKDKRIDKSNNSGGRD